jgi:hypothetical protein
VPPAGRTRRMALREAEVHVRFRLGCWCVAQQPAASARIIELRVHASQVFTRFSAGSIRTGSVA